MKRLTLFLATVLLFVQCQSAGDISIVEPLKFKGVRSTRAMAKLIDELSVVELKYPEDIYMGMVSKVLKRGDGGYVVLTNEYNRIVLLFDAEGEFLSDVTSGGYIDGEMRAVEDIAINYQTNELYLLDALNKVFVYDATTGEFSGRIKPQWVDGTYRLDAIAPLESEGGFAVVSSNTELHRSDELRSVVTTFDALGGQANQYLETDDYMIDRSLISQTDGNRYILRPFDSRNTIYEFVDGIPERLYDIDFGKRSVPAYSSYNEDGVLKFAQFFESRYYKFVNNVTLTPNTMSFVANGPKGSAAHYIYDRNSGRGIRFAAKDGSTYPAPFYLGDNEFHYMVLDKYSTDSLEERGDVLSRYIIEQLGVLDSGEGYKLVGVKFKSL